MVEIFYLNLTLSVAYAPLGFGDLLGIGQSRAHLRRYVHGITAPVRLELGARANRFHVREFNPRTGEFRELPEVEVRDSWQFTPRLAEDWVMQLEAELIPRAELPQD